MSASSLHNSKRVLALAEQRSAYPSAVLTPWHGSMDAQGEFSLGRLVRTQT